MTTNTKHTVKSCSCTMCVAAKSGTSTRVNHRMKYEERAARRSNNAELKKHGEEFQNSEYRSRLG